MKSTTTIMRLRTLLLICLMAIPAFAGNMVIGYFPFWAQYSQFSPSNIKYSNYTHVVYGYFIPTEDGSLVLADDSDDANFKELVKLAKAASVKVIVSIGGPGNAESIQAVAAEAGLRTAFVANIAKMVSENSLDGIELSWEFPAEEDKDNFAALLDETKTALAGKATLSATVHYSEQGAYDASKLALLDWVSILALDMATAEDGEALPNCDAVKAAASLDSWNAAGIAKDKLILAVPLYGRSYFSAKSLGGSHDGVGSGNEGIVTWNELMSKFDGDEYKVSFDETTKSEYAVSDNELVVFNGIPSIKFLSEKIKNDGYAGIQLADVASDHKEAVVSLVVTAGLILRPDVKYGKKK
jgi:chitinase